MVLQALKPLKFAWTEKVLSFFLGFSRGLPIKAHRFSYRLSNSEVQQLQKNFSLVFKRNIYQDLFLNLAFWLAISTRSPNHIICFRFDIPAKISQINQPISYFNFFFIDGIIPNKGQSIRHPQNWKSRKRKNFIFFIFFISTEGEWICKWIKSTDCQIDQSTR